MRAIEVTRAFALAALIAAGVAGFLTRWESLKAEPPRSPSSLDALVGLELNDGAVVDQVLTQPTDGVRLRLAECRDPAFLFPLPIEWVSTAETLTRALASPDRRMIDVYRGEIQRDWRPVNRIFDYVKANVRSMGGATPNADSYVRVYLGAHCQVDERLLVDWANTVLAPSL
jgi:hypothetical protein